MIILWGRLKRLSEDIVCRPVTITLTTDVALNGYSGVSNWNKARAVILINGREEKSLDSVIEVLAHELAHVVTDSKEHDDAFDKEAKRIKKYIKTMYEEE